jgi:hypothetical protein
MARVTLTIETNHEELSTVLQDLLAMTSSDGTTAASGTDVWNEEEIASFLDLLTTDAREILAEIATRPEGYPWAALQERFGLDGLEIGGRMSSTGHALRKFPGKKPLHVRDYQRREYRMDPAYAQMVLEYVGQR